MIYPDRVPPGESLPWLSRQHAARVELETERRMTWLHFACRAITLVMTYVALGPAASVVIGLHLLLAGLLSVTQSGRLALPLREVKK
jgi:hypothetical protein